MKGPTPAEGREALERVLANSECDSERLTKTARAYVATMEAELGRLRSEVTELRKQRGVASLLNATLRARCARLEAVERAAREWVRVGTALPAVTATELGGARRHLEIAVRALDGGR